MCVVVYLARVCFVALARDPQDAPEWMETLNDIPVGDFCLRDGEVAESHVPASATSIPEGMKAWAEKVNTDPDARVPYIDNVALRAIARCPFIISRRVLSAAFLFCFATLLSLWLMAYGLWFSLVVLALYDLSVRYEGFRFSLQRIAGSMDRSPAGAGRARAVGSAG